VVARVASITSIGTAIEHIESVDGKLRDALASARKSHYDSADFLAILAGHYWNESVIRYTMDGRSWKMPRSTASALAKRAVSLDPAVVQRSPFLYSILGRSPKSGSADKSEHSAPRYIAGFRLGWDINVARDACEIEGFEFKPFSNLGYQCGKPPSTDSLTGPVQVRLCSGKVCRVDVIDRPSRALSKVWVNDLKRIYRQFKGRYGQHHQQSIHMPTACNDNLLSCLEKGTARIVYKWAWEGRTLTLTLGRLDGKPTIRITLRDS
jgi:hypothetical protein